MSSGAPQRLLDVDVDCDDDTLRFTVEQAGRGFCHHPQTTCFGDLDGFTELERRLVERKNNAPEGSYTYRLMHDPSLLASKIAEEAGELNEATDRHDIVHEAADVLFFTMTRLAAEGIDLREVERELDRRAGIVTRRD